MQFEKDFLKTPHSLSGASHNGDPHLVDTLTTAMAKIKQIMESLTKNLNSKVESLEKDLVEPLDVYHRHYKAENHESLKEGTVFWNSIHTERTGMLFAKENYYN